MIRGQVAQDLGELAGSELARSTGAGGIISQLFHLFICSSGHRPSVHRVIASSVHRFIGHRIQLPAIRQLFVNAMQLFFALEIYFDPSSFAFANDAHAGAEGEAQLVFGCARVHVLLGGFAGSWRL